MECPPLGYHFFGGRCIRHSGTASPTAPNSGKIHSPRGHSKGLPVSRAPRLRLTGPHGPIKGSGPDALGISPDRCSQLHRIMVRARVMEERLIKMSKSGEGYFWIGGPGEEAFNSCVGLHVKKGLGPDYDYLHLKYRASAVVL